MLPTLPRRASDHESRPNMRPVRTRSGEAHPRRDGATEDRRMRRARRRIGGPLGRLLDRARWDFGGPYVGPVGA